MMLNITENKLIQESFVSQFLPQIVEVCRTALRRNQKRRPVEPLKCVLERHAAMALCKLMCVSSEVCQDNLDLVFDLLQSKAEAGLKSNSVIAVADLYSRFPNLLNEQRSKLFGLLHDGEGEVRRQALVVITHLILNDMLKLRGEIVDICMLLEDPDEQIKEYVKLFLHELHSKGQDIIYNLFPNAIQRLSNEFADLDPDDFRNISKHLLDCISKEKQLEYIIVMLCNKLKKPDDPMRNQQNEWRNSAICLAQIDFNERLLQKLIDQYESWKERMIDHEPTKESFVLIAANLKKQNPGRELKAKIDEFESRVRLGRESAEPAAQGELQEESERREDEEGGAARRRRTGRLSNGDGGEA